MTETERVLMIRENNKLATLVCLFRIRVETNAASVKLWKYGSIQSAKCKFTQEVPATSYLGQH